MKNNLITYAYRGFISVIYFIIGKKDKIEKMFILDDENAVNMDVNDVFHNQNSEFTKKVDDGKLHFRYKARDSKGKKINGTFDAYNMDQAKKYLKSQGIEIDEIKQPTAENTVNDIAEVNTEPTTVQDGTVEEIEV